MFAVTPRLLLRPGWPEDAGALFAAINDEAIVRNLARPPWPYRPDDARQFLSLPTDPAFPSWLIFSRTEGAPQLAGCIGIDSQDNGEVELGYWISRSHWGRGYATEAGRAVLQNARALGHKRLIASHFIDNPASGSVLRKLGFQPTGQTDTIFCRGRNRDVQAVAFSCVLEDEQECDVMRPLAA
ncbi:MAG: GNAT family N-acetyltransferase [Sphingomonadales bacterium]|nr:GNAT family N-acetyltransferase [Sphingomonadales bacterium]NCO48470.1 GNAT family N-acetyltransferase [Sphingomonadales bacterium]NCO99286.1 GNAT family N-acetyltransferase [Sphingomonadales bacterium]NCP27845.1 GNAT family N-acetyltransferase [Sphingomonadales bacterium]NCP42737.1 GNAT family N-acetyltransferase [Sphingomonadales bacterium]